MEMATIILLVVWLLLFALYIYQSRRYKIVVKREFEIQAWANEPKQFIPLSSFLARFDDFERALRIYSSIDHMESYPTIYISYEGPGMGYYQVIETLKKWSKEDKLDFDIREKEAPKDWKDRVKRATVYEISDGRVTNMREGYFK